MRTTTSLYRSKNANSDPKDNCDRATLKWALQREVESDNVRVRVRFEKRREETCERSDLGGSGSGEGRCGGTNEGD